MRYRLIALCAAAVVAAPLPAEDEVVGLGGLEVLGNENEHYGGGGIINLRRSDETSILGDVGVGAVVAGDGDGTGVKNAKRSTIGDLIDDASDVSSAEEDFIKDLFKRGEEGGSSSSLIGDIGVGLVALGGGDTTGVKNAKRDGIGAVLLGDGDGTGVQNAKRDGSGKTLIGDIGIAAEVLGHGDAEGVKNPHGSEDSVLGDVDLGLKVLSDGELLATSKRSTEGDVGVGAVVIGDGDGTGVKNVKRGGGYDGWDGKGEKGGHGGGDGDSDDSGSGGLIGDIGVGLVALGDGDATGVKNAKRESILGDVGVGAVVLGDGDGTGVKNAKRDEDLDFGVPTLVAPLNLGIPVVGPQI